MGERLFEDIEIARHYQTYRPDYKESGLEKNVFPFLREKLVKTPDCCALDVGCGTGQLTRCLAPYFSRVIGVDVSQAQISVAKEFTAVKNIEYRVAPAEDVSFLSDESVDLITTAEALQYFDAEIFLKEVNRLLKPGGCLLIITYGLLDQHYTLLPDTPDQEVINKCRSLFDETSILTTQNMGAHARNIWETRQIAFPSYPEKHDFDTTIRKPLEGLDGFAGFLKSLGGIMKYQKENEEKGDIVEMFTKRLETILREVTSAPETIQLYLSMDLECQLYRKPF